MTQEEKNKFVSCRGSGKSTLEAIHFLSQAYEISFEDAARLYSNFVNSRVYEEALESGQVHRSADTEGTESDKDLSSDYFVCPVSGDPS